MKKLKELFQQDFISTAYMVILTPVLAFFILKGEVLFSGIILITITTLFRSLYLGKMRSEDYDELLEEYLDLHRNYRKIRYELEELIEKVEGVS